MSSIDERLLHFFYESNRQPVSGEEIARQLKLSRTAVWNHVEQLRKLGYEIEAQPHLGYRLLSSPDRLIADEILARLNTKIIGRSIFSFEEVDSTNDLAIRMAEEGAKEGSLVVAESQRKGRGRMGRSWFSPKSSGIWCSLILRPKLLPSEASQLTLMAGLGVVRAIKKVTGLAAKIKWPNDVMHQGKKVCGILSEMSSEPDLIRFVVLGIGINVNLKQSQFPAALRSLATSLSAATHAPVSRVELLCAALQEIEQLYFLLRENRFASILEELRRVCDSLGRQVEVRTGEKTLTGQAVDIDPDGSLVLRRDQGQTEKIYSGDLMSF